MEDFLHRGFAFAGAAVASVLMVFYFVASFNVECRVKPDHPLIWACFGAGLGMAFPIFLLNTSIVVFAIWYFNFDAEGYIHIGSVVVSGVVGKILAALYMLNNWREKLQISHILLSSIAVACGFFLVQFMLFIIAEPAWSTAAYLKGIVWVSGHVTSGALIGLGIAMLWQSKKSLCGWLLITVFPLLIDFSVIYCMDKIFELSKHTQVSIQHVDRWLLAIVAIWLMQVAVWHLSILKVQHMGRLLQQKSENQYPHNGVFSHIRWAVTHPLSWAIVALSCVAGGVLLLAEAVVQELRSGLALQSLYLTIAGLLLGYAVLFAWLSQHLHLTSNPGQQW